MFVGVVLHILDVKELLDRLDEVHVGLPPFLEAEVADRVFSDQIKERLLKERERGLEVYAVRSQNDVWALRQSIWRWLSPIVDLCVDDSGQSVQLDVTLHQCEHGDLVGDP